MNSKAKGILYIITAAFGFSMMSLFVKLSGELPAFQKAFFRNFVALIFIFIIMLKEKTGFVPAKKSIPFLLGRSFFGTVGLLCNFYALGSLNLSDANMLNKLSPFFAILFSVFLLKEKPNIVQLAGVTAAFIGSLLIIKPPTCEYIRTVECCIYIGKPHNFACVGVIAVDKQFIIINKHRIQKCVDQSFPVGQFGYVQIAQTLKPKSYLILIQ